MKAYWLLFFLAPSFNIVLAIPRENSGEVLLDYVTELERTVDELLNKIVFLENELDKLKTENERQGLDYQNQVVGNLYQKSDSMSQANFVQDHPTEVEKVEREEGKTQQFSAEPPTISTMCTPCALTDQRDKSAQQDLTEELAATRKELSECRAKLDNFEKSFVLSQQNINVKDTRASAEINQEILRLRGVLSSELNRLRAQLLNIDWDKQFRDISLQEVGKIEADLQSSNTYKELAELKGRISSLKRDFNQRFRLKQSAD